MNITLMSHTGLPGRPAAKATRRRS